MAGIISTIVHCISSFLWLCSQPVYLIMKIFETNYEAVSAVFLTAYHCLNYTAKALRLLASGFLSMVELIINVLSSSGDVFLSIMSAAFSLTELVLRFSISVFHALYSYGPWIFSNMWRGADWCFAAIWYCFSLAFATIEAVFPTPSVLLERLIGIGTFLHRTIVSVGISLFTAMQTASGTLIQFIFFVVALLTGTLTAVFSTFRRCADDLWNQKASIGESVMPAQAYYNRKLEELHAEIIEASSNAFGSFVDLLVTFFSVVFYVAVFAVVCLLVILVPMKFYSLYTNALNLANTLVGLFHRTLFRSERISRRYRERTQQVPTRFPRNREQGSLRERDVSDTDSDDSLLSYIRPRRRAPRVPRRRAGRVAPTQPPRVPQHGPQPTEISRTGHAANLPGSSGEQAQRPVRPEENPPSSPVLTSSPVGGQVPETAATNLAAANLSRQLEEERDRQLCVVCQDNVKNMLILPCKHLCICLECVEEITSNPRRDARKCPLCRGPIKSYLEVYA